MSSIEIKRELLDFINEGDEKTVKKIYEMAKSFIVQKKRDKMIKESEEDIKKGKVYSQSEVNKLINNWIKE